MNFAGADAGCYYHELFLRSRPLLAMRIPRLPKKGGVNIPVKSQQCQPNFYRMEPLPEETLEAPTSPQNPKTDAKCSESTPAESPTASTTPRFPPLSSDDSPPAMYREGELARGALVPTKKSKIHSSSGPPLSLNHVTLLSCVSGNARFLADQMYGFSPLIPRLSTPRVQSFASRAQFQAPQFRRFSANKASDLDRSPGAIIQPPYMREVHSVGPRDLIPHSFSAGPSATTTRGYILDPDMRRDQFNQIPALPALQDMYRSVMSGRFEV